MISYPASHVKPEPSKGEDPEYEYVWVYDFETDRQILEKRVKTRPEDVDKR